MDYRLEQTLNGPAGRHPFWDAFMKDVVSWSIPVFIAVIAVWFLVGWARGRAADRRGALAALIASGIALLVNQVISHIWDRPRPFAAHPGKVHLLISHGAGGSFPSDHAAASMAIAVVLLIAHRRLGVLAVAGAVLLGYARVYVGVHYPGDVLAGLAVGIVAALVAARLLGPAIERLRQWVDWLIVRLHLPLPQEPPGIEAGET